MFYLYIFGHSFAKLNLILSNIIHIFTIFKKIIFKL